MLISAATQPSTVCLFSSTSSEPLSLFSVSTDQDLPSDSFVAHLHDRLSSPMPPSPRVLLKLPSFGHDDQEEASYRSSELDQTVLHIQSPTIRTTYIQSPPVFPPFAEINEREHGQPIGLGLKHPWMHLQVRNLGREWSFETAIVDHAGRMGIIRFSTFQKAPRLKLNRKKPGHPPLLLLPLSFPSHSSSRLTPWSIINVHFPSLLPWFSSPIIASGDREEDTQESPESRGWSSNALPNTSIIPSSVPTGTYSSVLYVRVYANCRLRRIWFDEKSSANTDPWEFSLFSD
ncbi:hypothetical protein CPC08DRAFT_692495 [Agrocybe pediades]|nr:hypothetical protein CPC08DRAFT_692495 [Agrocybe pediades]